MLHVVFEIRLDQVLHLIRDYYPDDSWQGWPS
jgi:hypothetical protein